MWRDDPREHAPGRTDRSRGSDGQPRQTDADPREVFTRDVDLPQGRERQRVRVRTHTCDLRGSESRTLATVGAFRVVPACDLRDSQGRPLDPRTSDLRHLRESGLVRTMPYLVGRTRTTLVILTERGRDVLEALRRKSPDGRAQAFHTGLRNPRELGHDLMVYRAYLRTADRIVEQGGRIHRIVLDDELKREYQQFLQAANRGRPGSEGQPLRDEDSIERWAIGQRLPYEDGHVQFPDVRLEYEDRDGRAVTEDVEVETPHYRGGHAAAKARSGFTRYSSAGGRLGGGGSRGSGSPFDPGYAEDLLS
jgi:hypothetical protein